MINGFEEETGPLTPSEMMMVGWFATSFSYHIGENQAVTSSKIIRAYNSNHKDNLMSGPRVRKIINYIRTCKLVKNLVATSKGYYIENDPDKLKEYVNSLRQRADAILEVANSYEL